MRVFALGLQESIWSEYTYLDIANAPPEWGDGLEKAEDELD